MAKFIRFLQLTAIVLPSVSNANRVTVSLEEQDDQMKPVQRHTQGHVQKAALLQANSTKGCPDCSTYRCPFGLTNRGTELKPQEQLLGTCAEVCCEAVPLGHVCCSNNGGDLAAWTTTTLACSGAEAACGKGCQCPPMGDDPRHVFHKEASQACSATGARSTAQIEHETTREGVHFCCEVEGKVPLWVPYERMSLEETSGMFCEAYNSLKCPYSEWKLVEGSQCKHTSFVYQGEDGGGGILETESTVAKVHGTQDCGVTINIKGAYFTKHAKSAVKLKVFDQTARTVMNEKASSFPVWDFEYSAHGKCADLADIEVELIGLEEDGESVTLGTGKIGMASQTDGQITTMSLVKLAPRRNQCCCRPVGGNEPVDALDFAKCASGEFLLSGGKEGVVHSVCCKRSSFDVCGSGSIWLEQWQAGAPTAVAVHEGRPQFVTYRGHNSAAGDSPCDDDNLLVHGQSGTPFSNGEPTNVGMRGLERQSEFHSHGKCCCRRLPRTSMMCSEADNVFDVYNKARDVKWCCHRALDGRCTQENMVPLVRGVHNSKLRDVLGLSRSQTPTDDLDAFGLLTGTAGELCDNDHVATSGLQQVLQYVGGSEKFARVFYPRE